MRCAISCRISFRLPSRRVRGGRADGRVAALDQRLIGKADGQRDGSTDGAVQLPLVHRVGIEAAVGGMTDGPLRARGAHRDRAHGVVHRAGIVTDIALSALGREGTRAQRNVAILAGNCTVADGGGIDAFGERHRPGGHAAGTRGK
ncbi:hypothetical protein A6P55_23305 [Pandoraea pnomenusa]|nr:hypothetical protein A6P55_23305 [Pandoraea pnomenusa]